MKFHYYEPDPLPGGIETFRKLCDEATRKAVSAIYTERERLLVERLEIHLGRVPSDDEIRQHGSLICHPDGRREYQWKGKTFLKMEPVKIFNSPARSPGPGASPA